MTMGGVAIARDFRDAWASCRMIPYRSLANRVHEAGGYAKSLMPYAEFLWADFFRGAPQRGQGASAAQRSVVRTGVRLAKSAAARYLPGWAGRSA